MKVLFLDAYFHPERIAFTHLEHDLLERLVAENNEVYIVCPTPTRGVDKSVEEEYKHRKNETLYSGHVHVTRFLAPKEGKNPFLRALRYFWCNIQTYIIGKTKKECDIVFCNSTPPTQGWIAGKVARALKIPLVYSLQDVFPDSLVSSGLSKKGSMLWKIGRWLEDKTYIACSKIVVLSQGMRDNLLCKGVKPEKIEIISNWINLDAIQPIERVDNRLFDELDIDRSKYIVLYAGNFGEAQGADIILEAAEKLEKDDRIAFVLFGGGSGYKRAQERAARLSNVYIHPLMSQDRISDVYSMGDVALITGKRGVGRSGMPSKLWSILACNTPVIASFDLDSELCRIIEQIGCGISVEPENSDKIVSAIYNMKDKKTNHNSREYVRHVASKEKCTLDYLQVFMTAINCK